MLKLCLLIIVSDLIIFISARSQKTKKKIGTLLHDSSIQSIIADILNFECHVRDQHEICISQKTPPQTNPFIPHVRDQYHNDIGDNLPPPLPVYSLRSSLPKCRRRRMSSHIGTPTIYRGLKKYLPFV